MFEDAESIPVSVSGQGLFFFLIYFYLCIYLYLAALGLHCCTGFSLVAFL